MNCHQKIQELVKQRKRLEKLVEGFAYRQDLSLEGNLQLLGDSFVERFEVTGAAAVSLRGYLVQSNLPIEVTLNPLKTSHLVCILTDWMSHCSESSFTNQRLYTVLHRNSLFKTVFQEQRDAIDDYFITLNPQNMLIADDLFNLLQDVLSPYFLYEFDGDKENFFEKERALERFKEVVHGFAGHDQRILFGMGTANYQYIRRMEFQKLIEYWQSINGELTLLPAPRKMIKNVGIQTPQAVRHNLQVQTTPPQFTFIDLLNSTIAKLADVGAEEGGFYDAEAVERIASFLRGEKIAMLRLKESGKEKKKEKEKVDEPQEQDLTKTKKFRLTEPKEFFELQLSPQILTQTLTPKISANKYGAKESQVLPMHPKTSKFSAQQEQVLKESFFSLKTALSDIYEHYRERESFTYRKLQTCLFDLRTLKGQQRLINDLIKKGLIKNVLSVSLTEFTASFEWMIDNQQTSRAALSTLHSRLTSLHRAPTSPIRHYPRMHYSRPYNSHYPL